MVGILSAIILSDTLVMYAAWMCDLFEYLNNMFEIGANQSPDSRAAFVLLI